MLIPLLSDDFPGQTFSMTLQVYQDSWEVALLGTHGTKLYLEGGLTSFSGLLLPRHYSLVIS